MDQKVDLANQDYQAYLALLVFVVIWEIQDLKENRGPPLGAPQVFLVYLEQMGRKVSLETLLMGSQDPQERRVYQEYLG